MSAFLSPMQLIGEEEDVSVYDIADHPDFRFRTTDIVIRIGNSDGATANEDEVGSQCHYVPVVSPGVSVGACEKSQWESHGLVGPEALCGHPNSLACWICVAVSPAVVTNGSDLQGWWKYCVEML